MSEAPAAPAPAPHAGGLRRGEPAFRRMVLALCCAGLATFGLLYAPQPLLPLLEAEFGTGAAGASLAVSAATGALALALVPAGLLSDRWGRKPVMAAALFAASVLTLLAALAPGWAALLALRALSGLALAGVPAVALTYVGEETAPEAAAGAVGLYVAANAFGGMTGRLGVGAAAELLGWRGALALAGAGGLLAAAAFVAALPPGRAHPGPGQPPSLSGLRDPALPWLWAEAALLMGGFVAVYNFLSFRLAAPPYALGQAQLSAVFALYLAGMAGSAAAARMQARLGRAGALAAGVALMAAGLALTLARPLAAIVAGVGVLTFGFFAAHATASAWTAARAGGGRALAASLYLVAYYAGSSVLGSAAGLLWSRGGWPGVSLAVGGLVAAGLLAAIRLARLDRRARAAQVSATTGP